MPRGEQLDCKKAEPFHDDRNCLCCRWCGRSGKWTHSGKFHHRRGYRRRWPDPRGKKGAADAT
jgi:hypothetical protein